MFWSLVVAAAVSAEPSPPSAAAPAEAPPRARIVFAGNRVLTDDVYLAMLKLPDDFTADAVTAAYIERTLTRFLRESGYELSSVHAVAHDGQVDVGINEGRLEKIVWRGRMTFQTLRFTFALDIPHEVFNRPMLERQSEALAKELGIEKVWFVLVPTAALTHIGPQLEKLPAIKGVELLHEREPWELHFFFAESDWGRGVGLDLRSSYADGIEIGVNYMGSDWLFKDDRYRLAAMGGFGIRLKKGDERFYPAFSRVMSEGRWYSPRLVADIRPFLLLKSEFLARARRDLNIEDYQTAILSASMHMDHEARPGMHIGVGAGIEWRQIFNFTPAEYLGVKYIIPPNIKPSERVRAYFEFSGELIFDPNNNRWDRRHTFVIEAQQYRSTNNQDPWFGRASYRYQQILQFGWHDLWLKTRGRALWSDISFHDEDSAGEYTHGVFGDRFVRHGINATAEFRFSVTRDVFKLSLFQEVFAFGQINRDREDADHRPEENLRFGTAIGPGFHALVEGMFQIDIYGSFGVLFDPRNGSREFDAAAGANLIKVF